MEFDLIDFEKYKDIEITSGINEEESEQEDKILESSDD